MPRNQSAARAARTAVMAGGDGGSIGGRSSIVAECDTTREAQLVRLESFNAIECCFVRPRARTWVRARAEDDRTRNVERSATTHVVGTGLAYHPAVNSIRWFALCLTVVLGACTPLGTEEFPPNLGPEGTAPPALSRDRDEGWTDAFIAETAESARDAKATCAEFTATGECEAGYDGRLRQSFASPPDDTSPPKDFTEEVRLLYRVAACGSDAPLPGDLDARLVEAHCHEILPKLAAYRARYLSVAMPFLEKLRPKDLPSEVVYPFGGGDLVTALAAYPNAGVITTMSLELAGDPRRIKGMGGDSLKRSLTQLRAELSELLFVDDYSKSDTLKRTQRGDIPGELGLFLVGLAVHGYRAVGLRFFSLGPEGTVHYLTEREVAAADQTVAHRRKASWIPPDFSEAFANSEITFRKRGAGPDAPLLIHRHLGVNLANSQLDNNPALLRHLTQKGPICGLTKAASYLMWTDAFSTIRGYLLDHIVFMLSDSTGIPPSSRRGWAWRRRPSVPSGARCFGRARGTTPNSSGFGKASPSAGCRFGSATCRPANRISS